MLRIVLTLSLLLTAPLRAGVIRDIYEAHVALSQPLNDGTGLRWEDLNRPAKEMPDATAYWNRRVGRAYRQYLIDFFTRVGPVFGHRATPSLLKVAEDPGLDEEGYSGEFRPYDRSIWVCTDPRFKSPVVLLSTLVHEIRHLEEEFGESEADKKWQLLPGFSFTAASEQRAMSVEHHLHAAIAGDELGGYLRYVVRNIVRDASDSAVESLIRELHAARFTPGTPRQRVVLPPFPKGVPHDSEELEKRWKALFYSASPLTAPDLRQFVQAKLRDYSGEIQAERWAYYHLGNEVIHSCAQQLRRSIPLW